MARSPTRPPACPNFSDVWGENARTLTGTLARSARPTRHPAR